MNPEPNTQPEAAIALSGEETMNREWSQKFDKVFAEAVDAIAEDIKDNGTSFESSLEHYASLYEIEVEALRHEWNLRKEDCR